MSSFIFLGVRGQRILFSTIQKTLIFIYQAKVITKTSSSPKVIYSKPYGVGRQIGQYRLILLTLNIHILLMLIMLKGHLLEMYSVDSKFDKHRLILLILGNSYDHNDYMPSLIFLVINSKGHSLKIRIAANRTTPADSPNSKIHILVMVICLASFFRCQRAKNSLFKI
ncbi:hypothetical protein Avbf_06967 [Armadillidium vulgare]|nr:hypothetical protein Avbf_06967 [Armadillidium vulgare]